MQIQYLLFCLELTRNNFFNLVLDNGALVVEHLQVVLLCLSENWHNITMAPIFATSKPLIRASAIQTFRKRGHPLLLQHLFANSTCSGIKLAQTHKNG